MKHVAILLALFLSVGSIGRAQSPYEHLKEKAQRFFDNSEWSSANAMYLLMLEQNPRDVNSYAGAAVSDIMAGDTIQALNLIPVAMDNEVSVDSLLSGVKTLSFSIGHGDLYENYLLGIKKNYPWFSRVADNYLMQYYSFRQNGPELVRYARTMLDGLPDNLNFLRMLAYGLLLTGDNEGAAKIWNKIATLYPDNYDTVLDLANFYDASGERMSALKWMKRADEMHPTPYVKSRISALSEL